MREQMLDDFGKPLTQSNVGESIWSLYEADQQVFKAAVTDYFRLAYPNLVPVKFNYVKRIVWLKDIRR